MQTTAVEFFSEGERISALWRTPDGAAGRLKAIVQGPGWLGLKDAKLYVRYHEALTEAGYGVLVIDYRGFGDSGGARELSPAPPARGPRQRRHLPRDARGRRAPTRSARSAPAAPAAATSILLAAADPRVRAVVSQVPVADGRDWLHRMRSESDWLAFLAVARRGPPLRVITGAGPPRAPARGDHGPDRRAPHDDRQGRRRRPHPERRLARRRRRDPRLPTDRRGARA